MPAFPRKNERGVQIGHRHFEALLEDRARDLGFGLLAICVQLLKLCGEGAGARLVLGQEHFDHVVALAMRPAALIRGARETRPDRRWAPRPA
jgi:hypothetical protein